MTKHSTAWLLALSFSTAISVCSGQSAYALRAMAPQPDLAAKDVPAIIEQLKSADAGTQMNALSELTRVKPIEAASPALPFVITIAKAKNPDPKNYYFYSTQNQAIHALGQLPKTDESIQVLFAAAKQDEACKQPASPTSSVLPVINDGKANDEMRKAEELKRVAMARALPTATLPEDCGYKKDLNYAAAQNLPIDDKYLPQITELLKNSDGSFRNAVIQRFSPAEKLSPAASELLKSTLTHDSDSSVLTTVAQVIESHAKNNPEFAPALIAATKNEKEAFRKLFYIRALVATGGVNIEELPLFISILSNPQENESSRYSSAQVIGALGDKAVSAVPALAAAVANDTNELTRGYAAEALGKIGPSAKDALPTLIAMLSNRQATNYRYMAATAIGKIANAQHKEATQALIAALSDKESETQKQAMLALQTQHNSSPEVIAALKALSITEGSLIAKIYLETLAALDSSSKPEQHQLAKPKPIEETLLAELNDADEKVQQNALLQIKRQGKANKDFAPAVIKILGAKDTLNRWYAMNVLELIGEPAKAAIPDLIKILNAEPRGNDITYACNALAAVGPDDESALKALAAIMEKGGVFVSDAPAMALAKMGNAGVPYLIEGLKSKELYTIYVAAAGLAATTGDAHEAVPLLLEILNTPEKLGVFTTQGYTTSARIIDALKHIAPNSPELEKAMKLAATLKQPVHR